MTDMELLKKMIDDRGVKYSFLADKLDMSRQGFSQKLAIGGDFKAWQMLELVDALHLTDDEARRIFYPQDVDTNTVGAV